MSLQIANCRKCGSFALQSLSQDGKRYGVHCFNEFSTETFDCDAPEGPKADSSAESIRLWNEMQTARACDCGPGECSGPVGVRCALSEFVVDRPRASQGEPAILGVDLAKPGSDRTVYWCPHCKQENPSALGAIGSHVHQCPGWE